MFILKSKHFLFLSYEIMIFKWFLFVHYRLYGTQNFHSHVLYIPYVCRLARDLPPLSSKIVTVPTYVPYGTCIFQMMDFHLSFPVLRIFCKYVHIFSTWNVRLAYFISFPFITYVRLLHIYVRIYIYLWTFLRIILYGKSKSLKFENFGIVTKFLFDKNSIILVIPYSTKISSK